MRNTWQVLATFWASTCITATTTPAKSDQEGPPPMVKCVFCDHSTGGKTILDTCVTCEKCENVTCFSCGLDLQAFFHVQAASREKKSDDESRMNQDMVKLLEHVIAAFFSRSFIIKSGPCCRIVETIEGRVRFSPLTGKDSQSHFDVTTTVTADLYPPYRKLICFVQRTDVIDEESMVKPVVRTKTLQLSNEEFFCQLKKMGKLVNVPGDGSCGFHAMLQILLSRGKINHIPSSVGSFRKRVQIFGFKNFQHIMKDMWPATEHYPKMKKERKNDQRRKSLERDIASIWRNELDYGDYVSEVQGWFIPDLFIPIIMRMYDIPLIVSYSTSGTSLWNYNSVTSEVKSGGTYGKLEYLPGAVAALVYHSKHYQVLSLKKQSPIQGGSGGKVKKRGISLLSPTTTGKKKTAKSGMAPGIVLPVLEAKSGMVPRTVSPVLELSSHGFPGIANLGNTCYLGASLQFIFPMRRFLEDLSKLYFLNEEKTALKLTEATLQVAIACGALSPKEELTALDGTSILKLLDIMNQLTKNKFPR